ncbi:hypothetical protein FGADI_12492 [Fusarium gaditjirri]|uniref:Uncharacterized protein n=1 Tax=Fusarium gaditjirri TaxID=282569 RepID=A0A8H4WNN9_9HYPO|nr:hypothetical protein FGADI_12492 [Fusarium gaditjirri]
MASKQPPDPSRYDKWLLGSRRMFISHYLKYLGDDAAAKWDDCQKMAFKTVMESLKEKGLTQVGHYWLEHEADHVAWKKLFSELGLEAVEWPFKANPDAPNNISEGVSPTYQKWRLDRGLPIYDTVQRLGYKKPTVLSLDQRKMVWENCVNCPFHPEAPITGPFQIALPLWIDVYNLVIGEDDGLLNVINNEIVPPHLAVSWHNDDAGCITLVVGFSPTTCVNPVNEAVYPSIMCLWQSVIDWAIGAYEGGTVTLATFLRVRKAVPIDNDDYHRYGITFMTSDMNVSAESEPMHFIAKAQKNRNFINKCRPEVLKIVQKPLTEAKAELSRWVCKDWLDSRCLSGSNYDSRIEAAREIWVSSTTDERIIQEAVIWAWGPHDMAV